MPESNVEQYYVEVPEYAIIRYSEVSGPNNAFERLLSSAAVFKAADMTPMFLYDQQNKNLYVAARETWNLKLH